MSRLTTLYIDKEAHKFSAAHYTIFSASDRERLHGHNYSVSARIVAEMGDNGFSADYNVYKRKLAALCEPLDEYMLVAADSPYQSVEMTDDEVWVVFDGRTVKFPAEEIRLLPVASVTGEALAHWVLDNLFQDKKEFNDDIMELGVSSGAGQTGSAIWKA